MDYIQFFYLITNTKKVVFSITEKSNLTEIKIDLDNI